MSAFVVAKKEFSDGVRSLRLHLLIIIFIMFLSAYMYYFTKISGEGMVASKTARRQALAAINSMYTPTTNLLPVLGILLGYKAIAGEQESGRLKLLLGLPHSRRDVIIGKVMGRAAILTFAVLISYLVGIITIVWLTGDVPIYRYIVLTTMTIILGVIFVSLGITLSVVARSSRSAVGGAIGLVVLFTVGWDTVVAVLKYLIEEFGLYTPPPGAPPWQDPQWVTFLWYVNPINAFRSPVRAINGGLRSTVGSSVQNSPIYLEQWFGFVILLCWLLIPIGLAYRRFYQHDLR